MLRAAAGMHVETSSPLTNSIAAMRFLPILNIGALRLLSVHFQGFWHPRFGAEITDNHARLVASAGTAANPDPLWGELMTRRGQGQKRRAIGGRDEEDASGQSPEVV